MLDEKRLQILTESAKYDVSCSSSGSNRKNLGGLGNANLGGICHSFTSDGRCISLLKILMSNDCHYDCLYCVNRRSNNIPRATATPDEICELVMGFYKRNYIEGLFLSSAVFSSPNQTMQKLFETVYKLRTVHNFHGYIHLKGIPNADKELINEAAKYVDRMSFNIELPSEKSLKLLAPQKDKEGIIKPMTSLQKEKFIRSENKKSKFIPAGQTTQMIVGATSETDGIILNLTSALYKNVGLKRVYYSSYVPTNFETSLLPYNQVSLLREHRLYQADWLLRFYGFTIDEICKKEENLSEEFDPKCAWALKNLGLFPLEINSAPVELLIRVPGIGLKGAYKIREARKFTKLTFEDLKKMRIVLKRARHFITCAGKFYGEEREGKIRKLLLQLEQNDNATQLSLFDKNEVVLSTITGEF
ncbi:MAG: putative DNA modification/repair radical SAM protein [Clostridiales bacterium]|nr:putative DNA modification/repair radical SAM protein [Clostridiales bacterium]